MAGTVNSEQPVERVELALDAAALRRDRSPGNCRRSMMSPVAMTSALRKSTIDIAVGVGAGLRMTCTASSLTYIDR